MAMAPPARDHGFLDECVDVSREKAAGDGTATSNISSVANSTTNSTDGGTAEKDDVTEPDKRGKNKNLHEKTLKALQTYLTKGDFLNEPLEYEEVAAFNLKIHRYTDEKTRMRKGLLFSDEPSKAEAVEEILYNQVYQEEEFHAVGNDFFKDVLSDASDMAGSSLIMNSKTCNWLKKAAGLTRHYDPYNQEASRNLAALSDDSEEDIEAPTEEAATGKRVTRTRIRQSRRKRRQEKLDKETEGLRMLADVARDLETGQTKRLKTIERKKRQERAAILGGTTALDLMEEEEEQNVDAEMRDADIPDTIGEDEPKKEKEAPSKVFQKLFPNLDSMELLQIGSVNKYKDPVALSMLEWNEMDRRDQVTPEMRQLVPPPGTELPASVKRLGLEFRTEKLDLQERRLTLEGFQDENEFPVQSPTTLYESTCKSLMQALKKPASRKWAINEFFYSDIDKDWYSKKDILEDIAARGIPISSNTRLTKAEWRLIRRKVRRRPRRFSKRFISEQMKARNENRRAVRRLQRDPEVLERSTIPIGTAVTAYNKQFQAIRKGTVLHFDRKKFEYLVRFDGQEFGCESCPDSEIAMVQCAKVDSGNTSSSDTNVEIEDGATGLFLEGVDNADDIKDKVEREVLVTVLAVVKEAFDRKRAILKTLDLCAESNDPKKSQYISWLLSNLDRVNNSLQSGILHLQVMYGSMYATPPSLKAKEKYELERKILPKNELPTEESFQMWMQSIEATSAKIGEGATSSGKQDSHASRIGQGICDTFNLLLMTNCLIAGSNPPAATKTLDAALQVATEVFTNHGLPSTSETELIGQRLEQESCIEEAMKDLGNAVGWYEMILLAMASRTR